MQDQAPPQHAFAHGTRALGHAYDRAAEDAGILFGVAAAAVKKARDEPMRRGFESRWDPEERALAR